MAFVPGGVSTVKLRTINSGSHRPRPVCFFLLLCASAFILVSLHFNLHQNTGLRGHIGILWRAMGQVNYIVRVKAWLYFWDSEAKKLWGWVREPQVLWKLRSYSLKCDWGLRMPRWTPTRHHASMWCAVENKVHKNWDLVTPCSVRRDKQEIHK